jgi:hypothetical protein
MPIQTIFDLTLHAGSRTLIAATHGRSQWKLDLNVLPVSVGRDDEPPRLALAAPRPNPSRATAHLSLEVSTATALQIDIYDAGGRRVRALASGRFTPGRHTIEWDGADDHGRRSSPGMYFVRASGDGAAATTRVVRVE